VLYVNAFTMPTFAYARDDAADNIAEIRRNLILKEAKNARLLQDKQMLLEEFKRKKKKSC